MLTDLPRWAEIRRFLWNWNLFVNFWPLSRIFHAFFMCGPCSQWQAMGVSHLVVWNCHNIDDTDKIVMISGYIINACIKVLSPIFKRYRKNTMFVQLYTLHRVSGKWYACTSVEIQHWKKEVSKVYGLTWDRCTGSPPTTLKVNAVLGLPSNFIFIAKNHIQWPAWLL